MRIIIALGFAILLSSCVTTTTNSPNRTSWQNVPMATVIAHCGRADTQVVKSDGNSTYYYKTVGYNANSSPVTPQIGVNTSRKNGPLMTSLQNTNFTTHRSGLSLTCLRAFEVDARGMIIRTEFSGSGCAKPSCLTGF